MVEGLFDKIGGPGPHCAHGQRHVAMPRDDDHGKATAAVDELFLEGEAVHLRHADIGDQAGATGLCVTGKETHRGIEGFDAVTGGIQQLGQ